jgi:uncharacterized protein HemY
MKTVLSLLGLATLTWVITMALVAALFWAWSKIAPTPENVTAWRFDAMVRAAEARTQPCLRITGTPCPRPAPLVPNYCPFPAGGTP